MEIGLIVVIFFLVCAIVLTALGVGLRYLEAERRRRVTAVLKTAADETLPYKETSILVDDKGSLGLTEVLSGLPAVRSLDRQIQQAGLNWNPLAIVVASLVFGVLGFVLGLRVTVPVIREFSMIALALLLGAAPYAYVRRTRRKRLAEFEEQFPESLDFLARSMRAGHAFSVSLEMMSDESPDPIGIEFRQVFNEQNLGAPVEAALRNLAERVPLLDVRFFVSAVLMQRETGGNLAEILTKLAFVIRERFRLKGHVKAVSAHGRITALILSVMPLITMLALTVVAPQYLSSMAGDSDGRYLIVGAITGQVVGYIWMKKIINIKV